MRLPNRKPGKYTFPTFDPQMTQDKFDAFKEKLARVKDQLPQAIKDTRRYAENGDFSENAEYQIAKGRLRGLNRAVDELQHQITHAVIIQPTKETSTVAVGHTVTITGSGVERRFQILGSSETNPMRGIISYQSPLGSALLGHAVGDIITVDMGQTTMQYTIVSIA